MMQRFLPIFALALLGAGCVPHPADAQTVPAAKPAPPVESSPVVASNPAAEPGDELEAVKATLFELYDALSVHDGDAYAALCTPDYRLVEGGDIWDLDRELSHLAKGGGPGWSRENRFDFLHSRIAGDHAVLIYQLESDVTTQGQQLRLRWLESVTMARTDEGWRVALLHSSRVQ